MTPNTLLRCVIHPALTLLPARMASREARVMLIAIAGQESSLIYRQQIRGPARSYVMFERAGVKGVLEHHATRQHARALLDELDYPVSTELVHQAISDNDLLAFALARLLLWTLPMPLATTEQEGWDQYIEAWRPGKPRPESWSSNWARAEAASA